MQRDDKRFYHKEVCYKKYMDAKAATKRENEEWDKLYQYIIALHDLVVLPTGNITRLKDLRAGFVMKNGEKVRQWRTGPSFQLMYEAYQLAEDSIKWCITNKLDGSKDTKAINYGISIMINKLNEANQNRKRRKKDIAEVIGVKEAAKETNAITTLISKMKIDNNSSDSDEIDLTTLFD